MNDKDYVESIELLIKSGCRLIEIVSFEYLRVEGFVNSVARNLGCKWYLWSSTKGIRERSNSEEKKFGDDDVVDPIDMIKAFNEMEDNMVLVLEDFHPYMADRHPEVIRYLRDIARNKENNKTIILSQAVKLIPEDLSKEMTVIDVELPKKETLKVIVEQVVEELNVQSNITDRLLSAALGLTVMEAELAYKKAAIKNKKLTDVEIPLIINEKENIIKKSGLLEYYHPKGGMDSVGGLENLKEWVQRRGNAFTTDARNYGLNIPKGVLLLGVPGCGKSLTAKAIAKLWEFPLLRFDLGKVFGGIVGESEHNIRHALEVSKAIAPCVLWIDEIEKGFSGIQSSGSSDGGTTSRVFGTFLTWMQEKEEPVFVVATANDISQLPPELLRKGRFDEIFFVDLPSKDERKNIFSIHLKNKNRDSDEFNLDKLAEATVGFSGAEIEEVVNEALFSSYNDAVDLKDEYIINCAKEVCPLSTTMSEVITGLRKWANVRARNASLGQPEVLYKNDAKVAIPKLKSEVKNPFITD